MSWEPLRDDLLAVDLSVLTLFGTDSDELERLELCVIEDLFLGCRWAMGKRESVCFFRRPSLKKVVVVCIV